MNVFAYGAPREYHQVAISVLSLPGRIKMRLLNVRKNLAHLIILGVTLSGCEAKLEKPGAKVNVTFSNATPLVNAAPSSSASLFMTAASDVTGPAAISTATPATFEMKFTAIILLKDNGQGGAAMNNGDGEIWVHPDCGGHMCMSIKQYIDFSDPTALNERLNREAQEIVPGTYSWIQLTGHEGNDAIRFKLPSGNTYEVGGGVATIVNGKAENFLKLDPPLTIQENQTVTVNLAYDFTDAVQTNAGNALPDRSCAAPQAPEEGPAVCMFSSDLKWTVKVTAD